LGDQLKANPAMSHKNVVQRMRGSAVRKNLFQTHLAQQTAKSEQIKLNRNIFGWIGTHFAKLKQIQQMVRN